MLPEIDVLDICTPPSSHQQYILAAARAGKHVIVEKPLTGFYGSPEKTSKREMLDAVVQSGRGDRRRYAARVLRSATRRISFTRLRCRRSGRSSKNRGRRSYGCRARNRTTAPTRRFTGSGACRAAGR